MKWFNPTSASFLARFLVILALAFVIIFVVGTYFDDEGAMVGTPPSGE